MLLNPNETFIPKIVGKHKIHIGDILQGDENNHTFNEPVAAIVPKEGISITYLVTLRGERRSFGALISNGTKVNVYCPHKK